jgi:hypothetical protein
MQNRTVRCAGRVGRCIAGNLALLALVAACSGDPSAPDDDTDSGTPPSTPPVTPPVVPVNPPPPASIASIKMFAPSSVLTVGSNKQFFAALGDSAGNLLTGRTLTWKSTNVEVATVSSSGVVNALAPGVTEISASIDAHTAKASVTVVASGFGSARGTVRDASSGALVHSETFLSILASSESNPEIARQTPRVNYDDGTLSFDRLATGRWTVRMSGQHWWSFVFPGLQLYADTTLVLDVLAGETTVIPPVLLRPRAPVLLIAVETCPWDLPNPPTITHWGDCDSGYWGGADVRVKVDGVAGTSTAGIHLETEVGPARYSFPPSSWENTPWSKHFALAPGEYDVSLVRVAPSSNGTPWNLVPWQAALRRVKVTPPLAYVEFDFYWHK